MANPSLAMIPSGAKATKLYSVLPEDGTGDFTVVRASTATRVNSDGLIETVAANVPRLDYTGGLTCPVLLTEPQSTNLALWSEQFDNAYWSKIRCTVTSNITTAPDGTLTADKLIEDTTSLSKSIRLATISVTSGQYWHIVRLKQNGRIEAGVFDGLNSVGIYVDLVNAVFLGILIGAPDDYYVESIANGWVEVGILTTSPVSTNLVVHITVGQSVSYTGDGVSGIYIWGAEVKKNKDSYIPTTTTTVTRIADVITGAGDVNTFNSEEGVLFFEGYATNIVNTLISISDTTQPNRVQFKVSSPTQFTFYLYAGNVLKYATAANVTSTSSIHKIAMVWKLNGFYAYIDGVKYIATQQNYTFTSPLNNLDLSNNVTSLPFYGKVKQLKVFKTALSDAELISLTS